MGVGRGDRAATVGAPPAISQDTWGSLTGIGFSQTGHEKYAGPGHFNDPDMMIVGKVGWGTEPASHPADAQRAIHPHQPVVLAGVAAADRLRHDAVGRFHLEPAEQRRSAGGDQDPLGRQAGARLQGRRPEVWAKDMEDGSKAVGPFQPRRWRRRLSPPSGPTWASTGQQTVRDLWRQQDMGKFDRRISMPLFRPTGSFSSRPARPRCLMSLSGGYDRRNYD